MILLRYFYAILLTIGGMAILTTFGVPPIIAAVIVLLGVVLFFVK